MYRLLVVTALLIVAYFLIRRAYRDFIEGGKSRPLIGKDKMVQDPVCRVYVPRGFAITAMIGGQEYFFCSPSCAATFQRRLAQQPE